VIVLVPNELLDRRSSWNIALRSLGGESKTSSGWVRIGPNRSESVRSFGLKTALAASTTDP
jgi:hypothetical protein